MPDPPPTRIPRPNQQSSSSGCRCIKRQCYRCRSRHEYKIDPKIRPAIFFKPQKVLAAYLVIRYDPSYSVSTEVPSRRHFSIVSFSPETTAEKNVFIFILLILLFAVMFALSLQAIVHQVFVIHFYPKSPQILYKA